jgi:hypothetical protein
LTGEELTVEVVYIPLFNEFIATENFSSSVAKQFTDNVPARVLPRRNYISHNTDRAISICRQSGFTPMEPVFLLYAVILFWLFGGLEPPKPKGKPKTPEEELGSAITKYLSQRNKAPEK